MDYKEFVCYVSADGLSADRLAADKLNGSYSLAQAIRAAKSSFKSCPNKNVLCTNDDQIELQRTAKQLPSTFVLGLAWASANAPRECIKALLDCIELELDLAHIFDSVDNFAGVGPFDRHQTALAKLCG